MPNIPLIVAIVGLVLYFVAERYPKVAEVGRLMFFVGLLAAIWGKS